MSGWIVRRGREYLLTSALQRTEGAQLNWNVCVEFFYKPGSAHQFETEAAAEAIAFLVGGNVERFD